MQIAQVLNKSRPAGRVQALDCNLLCSFFTVDVKQDYKYFIIHREQGPDNLVQSNRASEVFLKSHSEVQLSIRTDNILTGNKITHVSRG